MATLKNDEPELGGLDGYTYDEYQGAYASGEEHVKQGQHDKRSTEGTLGYLRGVNRHFGLIGADSLNGDEQTIMEYAMEGQEFEKRPYNGRSKSTVKIGYIMDKQCASRGEQGKEKVIWLKPYGCYSLEQREVGIEQYRVTQAFVREQVNEGLLKVEQVPSADNTADVLTKALAKVLFQKHRANLMGPQGPSEE